MLAKEMSIIHLWKQTNSKGHIKKLETTMEDHQLMIYDEYVFVTEHCQLIIYDECVYMDVCACMYDFLF